MRWLSCLLLLGCSGKAPGPQNDGEAHAAPAVVAPVKPSFVPAAGSGDVAEQVRGVVASSNGTVVVYVGASWCGPCQAFHAALERGDLDEELAGVTFLEYDSDRDNERLEAADYGGRLIPRFALPGEGGRFSGQKIEGGIKGDGAVEHIMNRLRPLLASSG